MTPQWRRSGSGAVMGMAALVELREAVNLPRALAAGADSWGLTTATRRFVADIEHTATPEQIPPGSWCQRKRHSDPS